MSWVDDANASLLTDLYELTMSASYFAQEMNEVATFDLFVRELPERRNFLVACGLEQALNYLSESRFEANEIDYLATLDLFTDDFLEFLSKLRFTGEVRAIPEGEIAFGGEPLLSVTAPLIEAQIAETFLLNCITFQTMIASKAARVALASGDRRFVDFSPRRDHGADAALKGARAAFIGGASATSNVLAGRIYGIPLSGTMAHSYVMAFENEAEAFRAYGRCFPQKALLLIDTFDVEEGARRAVEVARELASEGIRIRGVRIDSGDLAPLASAVRKILDEAGFEDIEIILSGDLDEYRIKELMDDGVPVDSFGVGTQLGTSADAPTLGGVYKLVADKSGPKIKLSAGKATLPGRKQVYRFEERGRMQRDVMALEKEEVRGGRSLLECAMLDGQRVGGSETLTDVRDRCLASLDKLPETLRSLEPHQDAYPVVHSKDLDELVRRARGQSH